MDLMNVAAHVSLATGAVAEGPRAMGYPGHRQLSLWMPNGWGVSLTVGGPNAYDPAPAAELAVIRRKGETWGENGTPFDVVSGTSVCPDVLRNVDRVDVMSALNEIKGWDKA